MSPRSPFMTSALLAHLGAQGLWFIQFGVQIVIPSSLSVLVLKATPFEAGLVQTAFFLPPLLLLMAGGLTTKRQGAHRVLCVIHTLAGWPHIGLAALLLLGYLNLWWMALYAAIIGTFASFTLPARETLLYDLSHTNVQRGVMLSSSVQHVGKIIGMIAASFSTFLWIPALLIVEGFLIFMGLPLLLMIRKKDRIYSIPRKDTSPLKDILITFRSIKNDHAIRDLLSMMLMLSAFIGVYAVLIPLLIRDVYDGLIWNIGVNQISFWSGAACAVLLLSFFKSFKRKGLIIFSCAVASQGVFFLILLYPPMPLLIMCTFFWGVLGGVCIAMARTIVQEICTNENRSLILSSYQMSFFLGFPIGSFSCGMMINTLGIRTGVALLTLLSLVFLMLFYPRFSTLQTSKAPQLKKETT